MKVIVEFTSLEEFRHHMGVAPFVGKQSSELSASTREPGGGANTETPQAGAELSQENEAAPAQENETAPAQEPAVTEDFRIEVRKQLAALNRKAGYNRAAELIKEVTGAGAKLTEVALTDLPKIMAAAKEETDAD